MKFIYNSVAMGNRLAELEYYYELMYFDCISNKYSTNIQFVLQIIEECFLYTVNAVVFKYMINKLQ